VQACVDAGEVRGDARRIAHAFWSALHGLMTLHVNGQLVHGCDLDELAPALLDLMLGAIVTPRTVATRGRRAAAHRRPPRRPPSAPKPRRSRRST
jgi:hypothetical protein